MSKSLIAVCGGLSMFIGVLLLAVNPEITQTQFAILGIVAVLTGVFTISVEDNSWPVCFIVIAIGFYFLARAGGYVEYDWLRLTSGILAIAAGLTLFFYGLFAAPKKHR